MLRLAPGTAPDVARRVFEATVPAWSPCWGCLQCDRNVDLRDDEHEGPQPLAIDRVLHWRTYFGPGSPVDVDLRAVRRVPDVAVRELHQGTEISLGGRWQGEDALLELQRRAEPAVLDPSSLRAKIARRLGRSL